MQMCLKKKMKMSFRKAMCSLLNFNQEQCVSKKNLFRYIEIKGSKKDKETEEIKYYRLVQSQSCKIHEDSDT